LPWITGATVYYGTPTPPPVTAKGLSGAALGISDYVQMFLSFPQTVWAQNDMLRTIFMPPYSHNTGWPVVLQKTSSIATLFSMIVWLIPGVRRETRVVSFTFCAGLSYLMNFMGFPTPWYLPTVTTLSIVTFAALASQLVDWSRPQKENSTTIFSRAFRLIVSPALIVLAILITARVGTVSAMVAKSMRLQPRIVKRGNRDPMGR